MGWVKTCTAPVCFLFRLYAVTKSEIWIPYGGPVCITVLWNVISCSLVHRNVLRPY